MNAAPNPQLIGFQQEPEESVYSLLAPLFEVENPALLANQQRLSSAGVEYDTHKFLLLGNRAGGVPSRVGLFAGLDAGRLETVAATVNLLLRFTLSPKLAEDYALFSYPVVNPGGFGPGALSVESLQKNWANNPHSRDISWYRSEFERGAFHGMITLRSVSEFQGFFATVRSELIANEVVLPALEAVRNLVPLAQKPIGVLSSQPQFLESEFGKGRLMPPPGMRPWPFEIELFAPEAASADRRSQALALVVLGILRGYRRFISQGGDL